MKKLRTFFHVFWESLSRPAYYQKLLSTRFGFSFQYLFFLLFLFAVASTLRMVVSLAPSLPQIPGVIQQAKGVAQNLYPSELVVTVKDGIVSTNVQEPYVIDLPKELQGDEEEPIHLVTINTNATPEDYPQYQSLALVTKRSIVYQDRDSGGYKVQPLDEVKGEFIVNKAFYDEMLGKILPYADALPAIIYGFLAVGILLGPFFLTSMGVVAKMIYLLFATVLVWVIARVMRKALSYGTVYRLSMHGLTIPILVDFVMATFGQHLPLLYTGIFLVWMGVVFSRINVSPGQK